MIMKTLVKAILGTTAFILVLGYAGSYEYAEIVIQSMPEKAYTTIVSNLGKDASQKEIAEEYMDRREYYDNL